MGLRIGVLANFTARVWTLRSKATLAMIAQLERLGATVVDDAFTAPELSIPTYYVIAPAEASSNLSRF